MNAQTIAVKCPQCGNSSNLGAQQSQFGYEFTCSFCSTMSVLVINRQLYVPTPGERVCVKCGRVAMRDARVCQCSAPLVRKCVNPKCLKEFPVNHKICDYYGWPQEVNPTSGSAIEVKVQHAIRDLSDPDVKVREAACDEIKSIGAPASAAVPRLIEMLKNGEVRRDYIFRALAGIGAPAAPAVAALIEIIYGKTDPDIEAIKTLGSIGSSAARAVPVLVTFLEYNLNQRAWFSQEARWVYEAIWKIDSHSCLRYIKVLVDNINDDWCNSELEKLGSGAIPELVNGLKRTSNFHICELLGRIGTPAFPTLREISGTFAPYSSDVKKAARQAIEHIESHMK